MNSRIDIANSSLLCAPNRGSTGGYALAAAIGLAPVLTMLLSWTAPGVPIAPGDQLVRALALPVIAVEILVIIAAFSRSGKWAPSSFQGRYARAAGALVLLMLGTAVFAALNPAAALLRTILWFVHGAFAWSVFRLCERSILNRDTVATALMAGFATFWVLLVLFASEAAGHPGFRWLYDLPGLDNIRRGAYFAAPIALICIARFPTGEGKRLAFDVGIYILTISYIFWSGSRGAAVAIGAAYMVGAALIPRLRDARTLGTSLVASSAGIALAWIGCILTGYSQFWRLLPFGIAGPGTDASSGRTELWASTWKTILQRPLLGHGESQAAYAVPVGEATAAFHPHNLALQVLLAWGVAGALLVFFLATPLAKRALTNARSGDSDHLAPFMAMLVLILYSAVDGTLFHVHAVSIFALCAGMVAFSDSTSGSERSLVLPIHHRFDEHLNSHETFR